MIGYLLSVLYNNTSSPAPAPAPAVGQTTTTKVKLDDTDFLKLGGYIISQKDLQSVKLSPPLIPIKKIPFSKVDMRYLNKDQLDSIMSVKLRPTPKMSRLPYEIRHPCLKELLRTREIIH